MRKFVIGAVLAGFLGFVGISAACDCNKSVSFIEAPCQQCQKHAVRERVIEREVVRDVQPVHATVLSVKVRRETFRDRHAARAASRSALRATSCHGAQAVLLQTGCSCSGF